MKFDLEKGEQTQWNYYLEIFKREQGGWTDLIPIASKKKRDIREALWMADISFEDLFDPNVEFVQLVKCRDGYSDLIKIKRIEKTDFEKFFKGNKNDLG